MINLPNVPSFAKKDFNSFFDWFTKDGGQIPNLCNSIYYRMYLTYDNMTLQMPINPEKIKIIRKPKNTSYNIYGQGDIVKPKLPELKKVSWEGLFMKDYSDPLNNPGVVLPPQLYVYLIKDLMEKEKVVKLTLNSLDLVMSIFYPETFESLIKSFTYEERGGEPGDIYYSIEFSEYKKISYTYLDDLNVNDLLQEKIDRTQPLDDQKIAKLNEKPNEGKGKDLTKSTVLKNSKITPKSDYIKGQTKTVNKVCYESEKLYTEINTNLEGVISTSTKETLINNSTDISFTQNISGIRDITLNGVALKAIKDEGPPPRWVLVTRHEYLKWFGGK